MKAILGEKLGMTQVFNDDAEAIPVTVIKAGPCTVTQLKTVEKDGYSAIQIAYKELPTRKVNQPMQGHFEAAGVAPNKYLVELRVADSSEFELGQQISIADVLEKGAKADVSGVTKGKGFQGVMKRHNFKGMPASHGAHKVHRAPGSIGACATPARVFKGTKLPGRMGSDKVTILNLNVVDIDVERGLLLLGGAVPGPKGSVILVREAVKA